jgi:hypothetical protein
VTAALVRAAGLLGLILGTFGSGASGAEPKEVEQALKKATGALKTLSARPVPAPGGLDFGIGTPALTGLALLEARVPADDPTVQAITAKVRDAAYKQTRTYQISLCLMYLDRLGDPADVPLIQMLALRLLVGQSAQGGWVYECCAAVSAADEQRLRANLKEGAPAGKDPPRLHPDLEQYGRALLAARKPVDPGDNSNTQFAVLALWMSRKHGVPVEPALDLMEKRFVALQDPGTGNWSYQAPKPDAKPDAAPAPPGSPAMYCAGLIGMAVSLARREEQRAKTVPPETKPTDPFYQPAGGGAKKRSDPRELVAFRAFAGLSSNLAEQARSGKGLFIPQAARGQYDMYFLWSLERVCVIYGVDKIGGFDWYDAVSTTLVRTQGADGSWPVGLYGSEVNTALAALILCKANLARDLTGKLQKDQTSTELRAGSGPSAGELFPKSIAPVEAAPAAPPDLPNPTGDASVALASVLLKSTDAEWKKLLPEARDGKGPALTRALLLTAERAEGDRKKEARNALAERLCRMTAATLRGMLQAEEPELRRAAALACAMKDDKDHVPDLIGVLIDADEGVCRAARAGLKSLTGKDFGPAPGASAAQKAAAVAEWRAWLAREKKK